MKRTFIITVFILMFMMANSQNYIKLDANFYSPSIDQIRMVDIYLPGDYYLYPEKEFPVIYYLHGGGGNQNSGSQSAITYYTNHYADSSITSPAAIFVCPDGSCPPYMGCMWVNSELYGNYEDYVITDVREFVQSNFRVLQDKNFQFIQGHSMGGFGAAFLATKHPDLFRAACPSAGGFSWPDTLLNAWHTYLYEENNGFNFEYNAGKYTQVYFTLCGGFSPDTNAVPWLFESLYDTLGNVVEEVYSKWNGFMSAKMIKDIPPENNLAFFLICGVEDELSFFPSNLDFTDTLQKYGRYYQTAWHNYGHTVFDPVSYKKMFHWVDSLIMESYSHLDVPHFNFNLSHIEMACYPNPLSETISAEIILPEPGRVSVRLYDQMGKCIRQLYEGYMDRGKNQIHEGTIDLPSGIYFCRVQWRDAFVTQKLVKL